MHGGVGAHQLVAALPIQLPADGRAHRGERGVFCEEVEHIRPGLLDLIHRDGLAVEGQLAGIVGLSAPAGIKGRPVEDHGVLIGVHAGDGGLEGLQVAVGLIEQFSHGVPPCGA